MSRLCLWFWIRCRPKPFCMQNYAFSVIYARRRYKDDAAVFACRYFTDLLSVCSPMLMMYSPAAGRVSVVLFSWHTILCIIRPSSAKMRILCPCVLSICSVLPSQCMAGFSVVFVVLILVLLPPLMCMRISSLEMSSR